jgi:polysaccharide deacetylase 2 family uncharacterized protein YibQ
MAPDAPKLAIVIDDLGLSPARTRQAIALPAPLTLALLSYGRELSSLSDAARARGHELLVHVPMQPKDTTWDAGENVLASSLSAGERARRLEWALSRFDGYVGINNHMGSAFTEDEAGMRAVLTTLRERGLMFLDSRTTPISAAPALAKRLGVPFAQRDVFLDNVKDPAAIAANLDQAAAVARTHGQAVAIGHPYPSTLKVLADWLPKARDKGVTVVPLSALADRPQGSVAMGEL